MCAGERGLEKKFRKWLGDCHTQLDKHIRFEALANAETQVRRPYPPGDLSMALQHPESNDRFIPLQGRPGIPVFIHAESRFFFLFWAKNDRVFMMPLPVRVLNLQLPVKAGGCVRSSVSHSTAARRRSCCQCGTLKTPMNGYT